MLFNQVQDILNGRTVDKIIRHEFLFRRLLKCAACGYALAGELQKGHIYYRCWRSNCVTNCVREEVVEGAVQSVIAKVQLSAAEISEVSKALQDLIKSRTVVEGEIRRNLELRLADNKTRMDRLVEAYIDKAIDRSAYEPRRVRLVEEELQIRHDLKRLEENPREVAPNFWEHFELAKGPVLAYKSGSPEEKRQLVISLTSNLTVDRKKVEIALKYPFSLIANRRNCSVSGPHRSALRTLARKLARAAQSQSSTAENVISLEAERAKRERDEEERYEKYARQRAMMERINAKRWLEKHRKESDSAEAV